MPSWAWPPPKRHDHGDVSQALNMLRRFRAWRPTLAYVLIGIVAAGTRFLWLTDVPHTLWVDEAWFGVKGREVLSGANWLPLAQPKSIGIGDSAYQIYMAAAVQAFGFPAAYSSRIASAVTGLLVVLTLYPLLLVLFIDLVPEPHRQYAALIGMGLLATLFTAILHSRGGLQMSGAALATVLTVLGLYLTFERSSWQWATFTGVVIGLGQITYEAALGLPLLFAAYFGVRWLWPGAQPRLLSLRLGSLIAVAALITFLPFLLFYWTHPGIFLGRIGGTQEVLYHGNAFDAVIQTLRGVWNVWTGISLKGDLVPGRNLVGRPLFDPFAAIFIWLGIGWVIWRARHKASAQLMLVWIAIMSVPSALSDNSPAFSRILPMTPGLSGFGALGALTAWEAVRTRWPRLQLAASTALVVGLCVSGSTSVWDYFVRWAHYPRLFDALYAGARLTADTALDLASTDVVFVTSRTNPFVVYPFDLLLDASSVQTFDASSDCLPYANGMTRAVDYGVIQVIDSTSLLALQSAYPTGQVVETVMHPEGYAYAVFYRVSAGTSAPEPTHRVDVAFEGGLGLVGYDAPEAARPGESVNIRLYWETRQPLGEDLVGFVHVGLGPTSNPMVGQHDSPLCADFTSTRWAPGFVYIETRPLNIMADAPAGLYDIRAGAYHAATGERVTILSADVPVENNRALLTGFEVR